MGAPLDPEEDPPATGSDDEATGPTDDDAAWRAIVANYGERPDLGEVTGGEPSGARTEPEDPFPAPEAEPEPQPVDPEDRFVPPTPPPVPRPDPPRLLAWLGLFGVPTFVLVSLVLGLQLPAWSGLVLMVWFVGGFVYLVASMRPGQGDDYDDGAVL